MNVGLDLGVHSFRSLLRNGEHLRGLRSRSSYSVLPDSPVQRRLLEQSGIRYATCEGNLVLIGTDALDFARLFQVPCISLLPDGQVPSQDPLARQILALQLAQHLPPAHQPGEICCFTSSPARATETNSVPDSAFFTRLVRLQGYTPLSFAPGLAVVLAELSQAAFTGIGCTFGAAGTHFTLAHHGIELVSGYVPRGGDWIDAEFARRRQAYCWDAQGNRLLDLEKVAAAKEAVAGSILAPRNSDEELFLVLYTELISYALQEISPQLTACPRLPRPLAQLELVCCGGTAQVPGFRELLTRELRQNGFPLPLRDVRLGDASPFTVARGCLINAELECQSLSTSSRAA